MCLLKVNHDSLWLCQHISYCTLSTLATKRVTSQRLLTRFRYVLKNNRPAFSVFDGIVLLTLFCIRETGLLSSSRLYGR